MSTSFLQYVYCSVCKISHNQKKRKHVYSQKHQENLKYVLSKFKRKVCDVKSSLMLPEVHPLGWQTGTKVWCYICHCEVNCHKVSEDCTLTNAGFLQHLAGAHHSQKLHKFFWNNLIPASSKADFLICDKDAESFAKNAEATIENYRRMKKEKISEEAARIRKIEHHSELVKGFGMHEQFIKPVSKTRDREASVINVHKEAFSNTQCLKNGESTGKRTVSAFGCGLTIIKPPEEDEEKWRGNIYTGALPPWMIEESADSNTEIGPIASIFTKHLQDLKKQKLPSCRVGAGFSHKANTSVRWLPAFGRVWNSGRRRNSQHQFINEKAAATSSHASKATYSEISHTYDHRFTAFTEGHKDKEMRKICYGAKYSVKHPRHDTSNIHLDLTQLLQQPTDNSVTGYSCTLPVATPFSYQSSETRGQPTAPDSTMSTSNKRKEFNLLKDIRPYKRKRTVESDVSQLPTVSELLVAATQKKF